MDLVETVRRPEGKRLEFKRDLSSPDGVLRTVVAFANTSGSTVLLGVEGASGHVRVGSTNRTADRGIVEPKRRYSHGESFDDPAVTDLG